MAYRLYYYKDHPEDGYRFFLCDVRTDISDLPTQTITTDKYPTGTPAGSTALVVEDGSVWILNNDGVWTEI